MRAAFLVFAIFFIASWAGAEVERSHVRTGAQGVMCLARPCREVAAKRIGDLIRRYHLKYVKVDLTTVFNTYGEAPGCYAQGHGHKTWAESLGSFSGAQLRAGINVPLPVKYEVEVLEIRK